MDDALKRYTALRDVLDAAVAAEEWRFVEDIAHELERRQAALEKPFLVIGPKTQAFAIDDPVERETSDDPAYAEDAKATIVSIPASVKALQEGQCPRAEEDEAHDDEPLRLFTNDGGAISGYCDECAHWWSNR